MTYLTEPTMIDLIQICGEARADEIEQYEAITGLKWNVEAAVNDLFNRGGVKFSLMDGNQPFCVGGWEPVVNGVFQSWMVGTMTYWEKYWMSITKLSRETIDIMFEEYGARRLQIAVLSSRQKTCEWYVRGLKFHEEGIMKRFGMGGEDVSIYVRLREQ